MYWFILARQASLWQVSQRQLHPRTEPMVLRQAQINPRAAPAAVASAVEPGPEASCKTVTMSYPEARYLGHAGESTASRRPASHAPEL